MMLKQGTSVTVKLGPFLDPSDGVTEKTGLTPVVEISKNGTSFAARSSATAVSHDAEGWYDVELDTTDTNAIGVLVLKAHDSANHLPVHRSFQVIDANVYDYGSTIGGVDLTGKTAAHRVAIGADDQYVPFLLQDDTGTRRTGIPLAEITVTMWKNGMSGFGATDNTNPAVELGDGWYAYLCSEADIDAYGMMIFKAELELLGDDPTTVYGETFVEVVDDPYASPTVPSRPLTDEGV